MDDQTGVQALPLLSLMPIAVQAVLAPPSRHKATRRLPTATLYEKANAIDALVLMVLAVPYAP